MKSVVGLMRGISLLMRLIYVLMYIVPPLYEKARELIEAAFSKPPPVVPPLPWPVTADGDAATETGPPRTVQRRGRRLRQRPRSGTG